MAINIIVGMFDNNNVEAISPKVSEPDIESNTAIFTTIIKE
ncbi:hypothetical protein [Proteocatella sphenisci]|nr:hypothetical protein [Proteocatella sphenisci]